MEEMVEVGGGVEGEELVEVGGGGVLHQHQIDQILVQILEKGFGFISHQNGELRHLILLSKQNKQLSN